MQDQSISPQEEWRAVPGLADVEVSSLGRVRRYLPQDLAEPGYPRVTISRTHYRVHELAAAAFLGERPPKHQVNHIDGNKANNALGNLEYVTVAENGLHAYRTGLNKGRTKLTPAQAAEIKASFDTPTVLARRFGVTVSAITMIRRGKNWRSV